MISRSRVSDMKGSDFHNRAQIKHYCYISYATVREVSGSKCIIRIIAIDPSYLIGFVVSMLWR